jgi:hypothetical protein
VTCIRETVSGTYIGLMDSFGQLVEESPEIILSMNGFNT